MLLQITTEQLFLYIRALFAIFFNCLKVAMIVGLLAICLVTSIVMYMIYQAKKKKDKRKAKKLQVAFYHPFCGHCGGGEMVLWHAIVGMIEKYGSSIDISIFATKKINEKAIFDRVSHDLGITFTEETKPKIVFIENSELSFYPYPVLTLFLQSVFSMIGAIESVTKFCPDIIVYFLFKVFRLILLD